MTLAKRSTSVVTTCLVCRRPFFAASLRFHQKECFRRQPFHSLTCETCHLSIKSGKYLAHVALCQGSFKEKRKKEHEDKQEEDKEDKQKEDKDTEEEEETVEPERPLIEVARMECSNCARKFHPTRIAKHESVCQRVNQTKNPAHTGEEACTSITNSSSSSSKNTSKSNSIKCTRSNNRHKKSPFYSTGDVREGLPIASTTRPSLAQPKQERSAIMSKPEHEAFSFSNFALPKQQQQPQQPQLKQKQQRNQEEWNQKPKAFATHVVLTNASSEGNPLVTNPLMRKSSFRS